MRHDWELQPTHGSANATWRCRGCGGELYVPAHSVARFESAFVGNGARGRRFDGRWFDGRWFDDCAEAITWVVLSS